MTDDQIYDQHTFYIKCGPADEDQLFPIFDKAVKDIEAVLRKKVRCAIYINVLRRIDETKVGIAYVWVSNPEVYFVILGRNADGTLRQERVPIEDPLSGKTSPVPNLSDSVNCASAASNSSVASVRTDSDLGSSRSWADMMDDEEQLSGKKKILRYELKKLEPLITLDSYKLNDKQITDLQEDNEEKVGPQRKIEVQAAYVIDEEDEIKSVLFSHSLPEGVSLDQVREAFVPFCTKTFLIENQKKIYYPLINKNQRGHVYVRFHPDTVDAQFALLMCKKVPFSVGSREYNTSAARKRVVMLFYQAISKNKQTLSEK